MESNPPASKIRLRIRPISQLTKMLGAVRMFKHFKSFILFYVAAQRLRLVSPYNMQQSRHRLMKLKEHGFIVREKQGGRLTVSSAHHCSRANIAPFFSGALTERDARIVLEGQIEIDPRIRLGIAFMMTVIFIYFPISLFAGHAHETFHGATFVGMLIFVCLLELAYFNGRGDPAMIIRGLHDVLDSTTVPNTALEPTARAR